jgi:hypothetical protein
MAEGEREMNDKPIIGQECICPDGMGRVVSFDFDVPHRKIEVATYIKDRHCCWDKDNVTLIPIVTNHDWCCGCGHWNGSNLSVCAVCGRKPE